MPKGENPASKANLKKGGPGRPKLAEAERRIAKAKRDLHEEFKEKLRKLESKAIRSYDAALEASVTPKRVLTKEGDVVAVDPGAGELMAGLKAADSISDRLYGSPKKEIELSGTVNIDAVQIVHE